MESPNDGPRGGGPTGGPPDPRTMSRAEYIRSVQASATARQQQIRELWKTYHGPIEEQVRRLLPEYQPGLLSRL
ncbi:hypothetical protein CDD83_2654 [Cordyceps sp. RAO-2017]|nr:hypothetical protein CDD83_2654 [Cordyceps sp. RAO-2017]